MDKLYFDISQHPQNGILFEKLVKLNSMLEAKDFKNEGFEAYFKTADEFKKKKFFKKKSTTFNYARAVLFTYFFSLANHLLLESFETRSFEKCGSLAQSIRTLPTLLLNDGKEIELLEHFEEKIRFFTCIYDKTGLESFKPLFFGEILKDRDVLAIKTEEMKKICQRKPIDKESYAWEPMIFKHFNEKNERAIVFKRNENSFKIIFEQLVYDNSTDSWFWIESSHLDNCFVESIGEAQVFINRLIEERY